MEIKKILWPTDFSNSAAKALDYVTSLTEKYQAEIHVVYVIEDLAHHPDWYGAFEDAHIKKVSDFSIKTAQNKLDQVCEKYLNSCPLYIRHVAMGDPASEILKLIESENVDMVVMATRETKGIFLLAVLQKKCLKTHPFRL